MHSNIQHDEDKPQTVSCLSDSINPGEEFEIAPLRGKRVIRDLVVDKS
jgi:succinate dehydrogenase/fumarate reductase-like Fe-S protein